jgi:pSer/pThr/pTyr-binding forkhead associated (FHA) protein
MKIQNTTILCILIKIKFRKFQPSKSVIRIGRSDECEIIVLDSMLSRIHSSIEFSNNLGWILRDGYCMKNTDGNFESKSSTNGTWYYCLYKLNNLGFI